MTAEEDRSAILERNWRQGCVLPDALTCQVRWSSDTAHPPPDARVVIVSHSCDILAHDFDQEPFVEVVAGTRIDKPNPSLSYGKSARRLDLEISEAEGEVTCLHLEMRWKGVVSRCLLAGHTAGAKVHDKSLPSFVSWLKSRYERAALPDTFNDRLEAHLSKIRKILKRAKNDQPLGIFFALGNQATVELAEGENYHAMIMVVLAGTIEQGMDEWEEFEAQVYDPLIAEFQQVEGIQVVGDQLVAEVEISWFQVRSLLRPLQLDYLTNAQAGRSP